MHRTPFAEASASTLVVGSSCGGGCPTAVATLTMFGIGIYNSKYPVNLGTLWRSALLFGADFVFTVGEKYRRQSSDTIGAFDGLIYYHYIDYPSLILSCAGLQIVSVELSPHATSLQSFSHPADCVYILGSEASGIPNGILKQSHHVIQIDMTAQGCLNVATAGSIVMYDRLAKQIRNSSSFS